MSNTFKYLTTSVVDIYLGVVFTSVPCHGYQNAGLQQSIWVTINAACTEAVTVISLQCPNATRLLSRAFSMKDGVYMFMMANMQRVHLRVQPNIDWASYK